MALLVLLPGAPALAFPAPGAPLTASPVGVAPTTSAPNLMDPAMVERQAEQRESMMSLHQAIGVGTLALLAGAGITGAMLVGQNDPTTRLLHQTFVGGGTALYLTGGVLSLAAPKPYSPGGESYEGGLDNITIHRWLAALHVAGMTAAVLSGLTATRFWELDPTLSIRRVHPLVGGTSIALIATSAAVMVLNF